MRSHGIAIVVAMAIGLMAVAPAEAGLHAGIKLWYQTLELSGDGATFEAKGLTYGPTASIDLSENVWVSGSWIFGTMEWEGLEDLGEADYTTQDAEAVLAVSFDWFDLGAGFRYSEDDFVGEATDVVRSYGPLAYIGAGTPLGDTPFGWYAAGSIMFLDLNDDFGDENEGAHFNVEGGLSAFFDPITATVGYRYKDFYNSGDDVDLTFRGFVGSAGIVF